ncbi:MAG: hypothetical protein K8953_01455, partial [Proteobacteria bacterium]|nr:hypothetical protein [Pseudomonadota bacterium]
KYSGGFVARNAVAGFDASTVRHATWARGFLLDNTPDTTNPRNQFLRSSKADGTLDTADRGPSRLGLVILNIAEFNNRLIGGDSSGNNRYEVFDQSIDGDWYIYAGILPRTDLGAPVVDGSTELTWYGNFTSGEADENSISSTDFVLNITINGTTGGTLSARANYRNTDYFILAGDFDASGLITGTVAFNYSSFDTTANGVLTGIIGSGGAIGVFHGARDTDDYYGGGFVARPKSDTFTDSVKYSDWLAREAPSSLPTAVNQFLQTTGKTVSTIPTFGTLGPIEQEFTLNLNTAVFDGAPILGDADVGFTGFYRMIDSTLYHYAGIFQDTDLGAPFTQTIGGLTWNGVVSHGEDESSTEFTITFNGTGGTIYALALNLRNDHDLVISGTFDDLGLITGDTLYLAFDNDMVSGPINPNSFTGTLSGLIGAEGAVGVFHSTSVHSSYAGGFIASPYVKLQANWNDWRNYFLVADGAVLNSTPDTLIKRNQFLNGDIGILSALKISHTSLITTAGFSLGLNDGTFMDGATYGGKPLGGNGTGGIKYWHGFQTGNQKRLHYAQINKDTKLGPIIDEVSGTATYNGQFRADFGGGSAGGGTTTNEDFTLTVTFGGNTYGGAGDIDAFVAESGSTGLHYRLFGSYDTDGVIAGDVQYGTFRDNNPLSWVAEGGRTGSLSGLISQNNTLGVFISSSVTGSIGFVGGFIARRAPFTYVVEDDDFANLVTYNDWNRIINPVATPSGTRSQFLQPNRRTISEGGLIPVFPQETLDFATAEYDGTPALRGGDARDGFAYFSYSNSPTLAGYSGIFQTTDLGGRLVETSSPTLAWNGQLNFFTETHDFTLNIEFDSNGDGGTIDGFVENVNNTTRDLYLQGDFDVSGVITGTTNYAEFAGSVATGTVTSTSLPGILSGLIGQEGAVGVFNAINSNHTYAGGFVVHEDIAIKADYYDLAQGQNFRTTVPTTNPSN